MNLINAVVCHFLKQIHYHMAAPMSVVSELLLHALLFPIHLVQVLR